MHLQSEVENFISNSWKSNHVTNQNLKSLHSSTTEVVSIDCCKILNQNKKSIMLKYQYLYFFTTHLSQYKHSHWYTSCISQNTRGSTGHILTDLSAQSPLDQSNLFSETPQITLLIKTLKNTSQSSTFDSRYFNMRRMSCIKAMMNDPKAAVPRW